MSALTLPVMRRLQPLLLVAVILLGCQQQYQGICDDVFWAQRPSWAEGYSSLSHTSDNTACTFAEDCLHSLHLCVNGRCRAWCDGVWGRKRDGGAPECPESETCARQWRGDDITHLGGGLCRGMTGPDVWDGNPDHLIEDPDTFILGACLPNDWLDGGI